MVHFNSNNSSLKKGAHTMQELKFYEKNVYGKTLIYPDTDIQDALERLTNRKTFTMYQLEALKLLGFEVVINKASFELVYL